MFDYLNGELKYTLLDGKVVSTKIKRDIRTKVEALKAVQGDKFITPTLAIVTVGDDPASKVYVKGKIKDCNECGFHVKHIQINDYIGDMIVATLSRLSNDNSVHGIILQLPLPEDLTRDDEYEYINHINPIKDVDCFTLDNIGKLFYGESDLKPCTADGIMELLDYYNINLAGKDVVIINRSNIVGKPLAMMMTQRDATVQLCHSKTKNLANKLIKADIVVVGVGKENFINADHTKPSVIKNRAVVIDVGINRNSEGKVVGDVNFENAIEYASYITPVPGGVGLMTRACLMKNVFKAYCSQVLDPDGDFQNIYSEYKWLV